MGCRSFWPGNCETVKLSRGFTSILRHHIYIYTYVEIYTYIYIYLNKYMDYQGSSFKGQPMPLSWKQIVQAAFADAHDLLSGAQYIPVPSSTKDWGSILRYCHHWEQSFSEILEGVAEEMHLVDLVYRTCLPCPFSGKHGATTSSMRSLCRPLADKDTWANR